MKKLLRANLLLIAIILFASFLRLWRLDRVPVSLFGDELDVGYHAYSILKTGKDYSGNPWPIHFHSLAEWRTPLYLYSVVPTVAAFGITPLGVRLPAATFGVLGVLAFYLLIKEIFNKESLALVSSFLLSASPWHLQYSRAGFEVTMLLTLLLLGLYFFFKSLKESKWLWLSILFLALTPWVYSTAKLFTPLLLVFLFVTYKKQVFSFSKRHLVYALLALLIVGSPIAVSTLYGGGSQRFGYISIFTDPITIPEVGVARLNDARVRGEVGTGLKPTILDRVIHNKFTFWGTGIAKNYFEAFSTDFLFVKGDLNLRHSIEMGEFYKIEVVALILGLALFFTNKSQDHKIKSFIAFWILAGVIPAAITREGGWHATRLILILPPLVFLISYGITRMKPLFRSLYFLIFLVCFGIYLHNYYIHYPWASERWWHTGWSEAISGVKEVEGQYDKIAISMSGEPAWIFFAAHYMYPPDSWQKNFPIGNDVELSGFGKVSHIDKFYFGSPQGGLYEWGKVLDEKTLFLANANEVKVNLILEPERLPQDLKLIKSVPFPSGEPAFYLFAKK